jgi:GNAT superfamily N-acetyltransferase
MEEYRVRPATLEDADWIVALSTRVQAALTASGSLQQIGPLPIESTKRSIRTGHAYLLETRTMETGTRGIGSVLVDPLEETVREEWHLPVEQGPWWYLHSFMLAPEVQGQGLGLIFLAEVKRQTARLSGAIVLDCWAGNVKLRDFYQRAGFTGHGVFGVRDYDVMVFVCSL